NTRAVSHTILGAISVYAVVNGTTTNHYLLFLKETLDTMDAFEYMRGSYLIMDNAPIH
ncbi:hypothetical protein K501DRAFT_160680, partial [Backusella circina FSU 941]